MWRIFMGVINLYPYYTITIVYTITINPYHLRAIYFHISVLTFNDPSYYFVTLGKYITHALGCLFIKGVNIHHWYCNTKIILHFNTNSLTSNIIMYLVNIIEKIDKTTKIKYIFLIETLLFVIYDNNNNWFSLFVMLFDYSGHKEKKIPYWLC